MFVGTLDCQKFEIFKHLHFDKILQIISGKYSL
jgi:hypothetical protein